jgi:tRNA nucleotidyltransferase (CCA-adding enzyme)
MAPRTPSTPLLADLAQTNPGLAILRHAALLAEGGGADEPELDILFEQTDAGFLLDLRPSEIWPEFSRGLMGGAPGAMIENLRQCGALAQILPEVAALYGVPQLSEDPATVDIGEHVCAALDEAARLGAPLAARFALLTMNVGKADSPREHLPVHYKHMERAAPRIDAICARFDAPANCRELALLALHEVERIHRISKMRAGPLAVMLERIGAFNDTGVFAPLMQICLCDYRAHPGHEGKPYRKAALIETALAACAGIAAFVPGETLDEARAAAIARAFRSMPGGD